MWKKLSNYFSHYTALKYFYLRSRHLSLILGMLSGLLFISGLIAGLLLVPPDYQQGDAFRILYVHVPSAVLSLTAYVLMAACAAIYLIWKIKLADILAAVSAPLGASFTFLALITGSLWGKPMWGTAWIWDARLTSELILLFLYLAIIALRNAVSDQQAAARACSILILVGLVDIPIIHYSVYWWNTLHQKATVLQFSKPLIAPIMLYPLLIMLSAFFCYFFAALLLKARREIFWRERRTAWVKELKI